MTTQQILHPVARAQGAQPYTYRKTRAILLLLALGLAIWGSVVAVQLVIAPTLTAGIGETIHAGDLAFSVNRLEWLSMNHDHDAESTTDVSLQSGEADGAAAASAMGFSMPPSMMPGLPPVGQQRLRVEVTLQNTGSGREAIGPEYFRVESADGTSYLPLPNSPFRSQELVRGQGMGAVLFVDVDEDARDPRLIWARGGKQVAIRINGAPDHNHASE